MKSHWYILLIPVALLVAWIGIARDAREQAVFLERVAGALENTRTVPPETGHAIQQTLASIRQRGVPLDERLDRRQKLAIERIEALLAAKEFAQTSGIVSRESRRQAPLQ